MVDMEKLSQFQVAELIRPGKGKGTHDYRLREQFGLRRAGACGFGDHAAGASIASRPVRPLALVFPWLAKKPNARMRRWPIFLVGPGGLEPPTRPL